MSRHRRRDTISRGAQRAQSSESKRHALTARGLFALPLLLALALSSLVVVVAAPQPVAAAGTYFTEDFNSETIGAGQPVVRRGALAVGGGVVTMPSSNNNVVRTNDNNYQTDSFCAEITVASYVGGGDNRAYLGFGPGDLARSGRRLPAGRPGRGAPEPRPVRRPSFADNLDLADVAGPRRHRDRRPEPGRPRPRSRRLHGCSSVTTLFAQEVRASVDGAPVRADGRRQRLRLHRQRPRLLRRPGRHVRRLLGPARPVFATPRTFTVDTDS